MKDSITSLAVDVNGIYRTYAYNLCDVKMLAGWLEPCNAKSMRWSLPGP